MKNRQNEEKIWIRDSEKSVGGCDCSKDVILPDLYRDVKKILWFDGRIHTGSQSFSGAKVIYDGELYCTLLFLDEENRMQSLEIPIEFSGSISLDKESENREIFLIPTIESLNVKMLNPRKFGIRSRILPSVKCWTSERVTPEYPSIFREEDLSTVEAKTARIRHLSPDTVRDGGIEISEDFVLDKQLPSAEEVLLCRVTPTSMSVRAGDGTVECKGELWLEVFYLADDGSPAVFRKSLPISRLIDAPCVNGESSPMVIFEVDRIKCVPAEDMSGQNRILGIDLTYDLVLFCANSEEVEYVTDLYSTCYMTENQTVMFSPSSTATLYSRTVSGKCSTNLAEDVEILAALGNVQMLSGTARENEFEQPLSVTFHLLTRDGKGEISSAFVTDTLEVSLPLSEERFGNVLLTDPVAVSENGVCTVSYDVKITMLCFDLNSIAVIGQVKASENDRITAGRPMTVYYPAPGENLWSVAKRYRISRAALEAANRGRESGEALVIPRRVKENE